MNGSEHLDGRPAEEICLSCGMCCNGVVFADVQVQAGDDPERLRELGLAFRRGKGGLARALVAGKGPKFRQPCAAYDGCRCRIYGERPRYCREFECVLLKRVKAGAVTPAAALRRIRKTRKQVETVKSLLRELGDLDEALSLAKRFRRTSKRLEKDGFDEAGAERFGKLTLALHNLNLLLGAEFYPGTGG